MREMSKKSINIALIEDNSGDVRLIMEYLKETEFITSSLQHFGTLSEALKMINKNNLDVILLDLNLPDSFGMNTIEKILSNIKEVPIIALTMINEQSIAIEALKKGIQDYLVKEYLDSYNLIRAITFAIERKKIENTRIKKDSELKGLYKELEGMFSKNKQDLRGVKKGYTSLLQEFDLIIDSIPGMIFYKDDKNNLLKVNAYFAATHGFAKEEFEEKNCCDLYSNELAQKYWKDDLEVIKTGKPKEGIEELWEKDGVRKWLLTNKIPHFKKEGEIVGIIGFSIDITKLKITEQELIKSENEYRTLVESALEGIWKIDENGVTTFVNQRMEEIFGYKKNEMIGKHLFEFMDKNSVELCKYYLKRREQGIGEIHDFEFIRKDGTKIHAQLKANPIFDEKGIYKGALAYLSDISKQVKFEKELQDSLILFEKTLNSMPDAIFILNTDDPPLILSCNHAAEEMFDYTFRELIGKDITILYRDLEHYNLFQQYTYADIKQAGLIRNFRFKMKKKGGSIFPTEHTIFRTHDEEKKPTGWISFVHDLTEVQDVEKRSKELENLRNDFVYRASHELKTPLTSIYSATQLLNSDFNDLSPNRAKKLIAIIYDGAKRLRRLIENLLDISRIESDQMKLEFSRIEINAIIHKTIQSLEFLIEERNLSLKLTLPDKIIINIDENRIEQVFINILSNAINYTPPGGEITIKLEDLKEYLMIIIQDTGIGFTPEEIKKSFKKFGKIERFGEGMEIITEGSGLGLYISKEIVMNHGGTMWIESEGRNKGSSIFIKLPKKQIN